MRIIHTSRRGRPKKLINLSFLKNAMSARRKLRKKQLALKLGMHPDTLRLRIQQAGIHSHHYSPITDDELDVLIREYRRQKPNAGIRYVRGWLFSHGIRVQKERVRLALRRIDGLHQSLAYHEAIDRRVYEVPRPHSLWHLDGHHKLIRWGIIVHGVVDGYSRYVSSFNALIPLMSTLHRLLECVQVQITSH